MKIRTKNKLEQLCRKFSVTGRYPIRFNNIYEIGINKNTYSVQYQLSDIKTIKTGRPNCLIGNITVCLPSSKEAIIHKILHYFKYLYLHELQENICIGGKQYRCPHKYGDLFDGSGR